MDNKVNNKEYNYSGRHGTNEIYMQRLQESEGHIWDIKSNVLDIKHSQCESCELNKQKSWDWYNISQRTFGREFFVSNKWHDNYIDIALFDNRQLVGAVYLCYMKSL